MTPAADAPPGGPVDVVVVTYRSAPHLAGCLGALPGWCRVIVVDNASPDGSADLAERLGATVLRNPTNAGFGRAVDRAFREAVTAERVLVCNPDARIGGADLTRLLAALDDPQVAVAGPRLVHPDGREQRPWWPFPSAGRAVAEALGVHRAARERFDAERDVDFVVGACMAVRRVAYAAVGGFDPRFWLYGEEADLCRRLWDAGWRVRYVPAATAVHVGGASGTEPDGTRAPSPLVAEHFARGSDRFVLTHQGIAALVAYRLAGLAGSALRLPLLAVRSPDDPRVRVRLRQVRRTARALLTHPTLVARPDRDGTPPGPPAPAVVVASLERWDEVWRRNQFLVRDLLEADPDLRVLWVDPPVDPLHELVRLPATRRLPRLPPRRPRPLPDRPRVLVASPVKWLPRAAGPFADRSLARQVLAAAARAELVEPTLWLNSLAYAPLAWLQRWPVLYDITDDWLVAEASPRELAARRRREQRVLAVAGEVVVCSPELARIKGAERPVRLVPNAVDVEAFRRPRPRPADLPAGPVAVYVGTLHDDRIDVDLLADLAADHPDLAVVLVGPDHLSAASRARLDPHPNVHRLGPRPAAEVPAYLQHADVVIVPHVVSAFTERLDPIKAYECLAVGRPTLATPVAGFRDLPAPVEVVDRAGFSARLGALVAAGPAPGGAPPAGPPAGLPSWRDRAAAFAEALHAARTPRPRPPVPPIRVVYVGHVARLSGGELALARLLPALDGVAAHVILGEDGPLVERLRADGISVEVLPLAAEAREVRKDTVRPGTLPVASVRATAGYVRALAGRLRALRAEIVHTNTLKAALYGGVAGRLAGATVVWHVRDRIAADYLPGPAVAAVRAAALAVPHAVIANSHATRATLGPVAGIRSLRPGPVVWDAVPPPARLHRPGPGPLRVGMVGRLAPWKGQDVFLRAFARAFPDGPEQAVIVGAALFGEDAYARSLERLAADLGLGGRVAFLGFRDDVEAVLAGLDVLVHASTLPEPFGQVVVEGMAAGLAVVAADAGGPREIITPGVDGLLTPPGDADALAGALRRLAADPALRARLGAAARARADGFRPEVVAGRVLALYRSLVR